MVDTRADRGKRIQTAIQNSGKTQREIADLIGVAPQSITKWIKTGKIYIDNLQALAEVTGVDLRYFFASRHAISEPKSEYLAKQNELHALIDRLGEQQTRKLILCAQALLESDDNVEVNIAIGGKVV